MLTATKDLMLPATVTGSWPRPRWYDGACGAGRSTRRCSTSTSASSSSTRTPR